MPRRGAEMALIPAGSTATAASFLSGPPAHRCRCNPAACPVVSSGKLAAAHEARRGDGIAERVDIDQRVARRIERDRCCRRPPSTPPRCRSRRPRRAARRDSRCGSSEALESWMPQKTGVCGSSPVRAASAGRIGPSRSLAGRTGAISPRQPMRSTSDEKSRSPRVPQIGVAAERGHLVGERRRSGASAQYCGYISDRGDLGEFGRKTLLLPEELRAEIEADRQARRAGLGEGRPDRVIVSRQPRRGRRYS